jgi:hypothetical protein
MSMDFSQIAPFLKDPLILVGFFLFLSFLFAKIILARGVVPELSKILGYKVLRLILVFGFIIGLLLILLGFGLKYKEVSAQQHTIASIESSVIDALKDARMSEKDKDDIARRVIEGYRNGTLSREQAENQINFIRREVASSNARMALSPIPAPIASPSPLTRDISAITTPSPTPPPTPISTPIPTQIPIEIYRYIENTQPSNGGSSVAQGAANGSASRPVANPVIAIPNIVVLNPGANNNQVNKQTTRGFLEGTWKVRCPKGHDDIVENITRNHTCEECGVKAVDDGRAIVLCPDGHENRVEGITRRHLCQYKLPNGNACGKECRGS